MIDAPRSDARASRTNEPRHIAPASKTSPAWPRCLVAVVVAAMAALGVALPALARTMPPGVSVTPALGTAPDRFTGTAYTALFTVKNNTASSDTYTLTCEASNATCTGQSFAFATLGPSQQVNVTVNYTTAATAGGGWVSLTASGNTNAMGSWNFEVRLNTPYAVLVTPTAGTQTGRVSFTGGYTAQFTIKNIGTSSSTFQFVCEPHGTISCTSQTQSSAVLASLASTTNTITYATTSSGAAWIQMSATTQQISASGRYSFTVGVAPGFRVGVGPDAQGVGVLANRANSHVAFKVVNTGAISSTFNLTTTCTGTAIASGCAVSVSAVTLAGGADSAIKVTYTSGNPSTSGTIKLFAKLSTDAAVKDSGWANVSTGTAQTPSVVVTSINPGTTLERSLCVTASLGAGAAAECGDLRLVHALPVTLTLNVPRAPVLLYSSAHAHPYPLVSALVTVPTLAANPDSIEAILRVEGIERKRGMWRGSDLSPGRGAVLALGYDALNDTTGAYAFTVEVGSFYNGARMAATSLPGQLVIVNRSQSKFGAGWWLAGLEQIFARGDGSKLWVGGDGSTRRYLSAGGSKYAAEALDAPDTLIWNPGNSTWTRYAPDSLRVVFNSVGNHTSTVNRLGHTTTFGYLSTGGAPKLGTIGLPSGSSAMTYTFTYDGFNHLATVTPPPVGATARTVTVTTASNGQLTKIRDPDLYEVKFGYDVTFWRRAVTRTDRRNFVTTFSYDPGWRVRQDSLNMGASPAIVTRLRVFESLGLMATGQHRLADTAFAYTQIDGPRTDVGDSTLFWHDRFGSTRKVQNALGHATLISRTNGSYPALVTRVRAPNGHVTLARYDTRGRLTSEVDSGGLVAGRLDSTRYAYTGGWTTPTLVVPPLGNSTTTSLNATNGNVDWQHDSRGVTTKVTMAYYSTTGLLLSIHLPGATLGDSIGYDAARGNVEYTWTPLDFRTRHYTDNIGRDTLVESPVDVAGLRKRKEFVTYSIVDRVMRSRSVGAAQTYSLTNLTASTVPVTAETLYVDNTYDEEGNLKTVTAYSRPDSSDVFLTDTRTYDNANRLLTRVRGSGPSQLLYDPAGNATTERYRNGKDVIATFDALNRPLSRVLPNVDYAKKNCEDFPAGPLAGSGALCLLVFPYGAYANNGTGYRVAADTSWFGYDLVGNLVRADNGDARIARSYFPNGALKTDTLRIRSYATPSFTTNVYGLGYDYDRNGRRLTLTSPIGTFSYGYHAFGPLLQVTEPGGSRYRLTYDLAGRLDSVTVTPTGTPTPPQGVREGRVYDADGRVIRRQRMSTTLGQLNLDNLFYDARGKIVEAQTQSAAAGHANETTRLVYDDLGAVVASEVSNIGTWQAEEFRTDAMGHVTYRRPSIAVTGVGRPQWATYAPHGALEEMAVTNPGSPPPQNSFYPDASSSTFTVWGGVAATGQQRRVADLHFELEVAARQYADASNRLRVVQRYSWHGNAGGETYRDGTFEELRYDALGRRVLARARRDAGVLCGVTCASYVERTVWDGDQLLFEHRIPGGDALTSGALDFGTGSPPHYGRVGYVHALGLDQPLGTTGAAPRVVNVNWRGLGESSVTAAGAAADCSVSGGGGCTTIPWPAGRGIYYGPVGHSTSAPPTPTFAGTLLLNGEGSSGLLYRRHRFFDPATGQFTQEDPIGLGGGVNVYGFAGGDPVNFSDPFGLCPETAHGNPCESIGLSLGAAIGAVIGGVAAGGCTLASSGLCGLGSPGIITFFASGGAVVGGFLGKVVDLIPTAGHQPSAGERRAINELGERNGCMTCGARSSGIKSGKWVPNHVPPTSVKLPGEEQQLGPHCINCSNKQGGHLSQEKQKGKRLVPPPDPDALKQED